MPFHQICTVDRKHRRIHRDFKIKAQTLILSLHGYNISFLKNVLNIKD